MRAPGSVSLRVSELQDPIPNGHIPLSLTRLHHAVRQLERLHASVPPPRGEPAGFTVVSVVGEVQLGSNEEDAFATDERTCVVAHAVMLHRKANVAENSIGYAG